jgi:hypothetical protein
MKIDLSNIAEKLLQFESRSSLDTKSDEEIRRAYHDLPYIVQDIFELMDEVKIKRPIPEEVVKSSDYHSYLALCLMDHDFRGPADMHALNAATIESLSRQGKNVTNLLHEEKSMFGYELMRVGLNILPYIATGDKEHLTQIPKEQFPKMLEQMLPRRANFELDGVEDISSDLYFAVIQLVKNSFKNVDEAGSIDDTIKVSFEENDSHTIISVKDHGTGIDRDKMHLIFGNYTEEGTGIGLQAVKRIVDLRGGYIEVESTTKDSKKSKYSTLRGNITKPKKDDNHGTEFKVYIPKKEDMFEIGRACMDTLLSQLKLAYDSEEGVHYALVVPKNHPSLITRGDNSLVFELSPVKVDDQQRYIVGKGFKYYSAEWVPKDELHFKGCSSGLSDDYSIERVVHWLNKMDLGIEIPPMKQYTRCFGRNNELYIRFTIMPDLREGGKYQVDEADDSLFQKLKNGEELKTFRDTACRKVMENVKEFELTLRPAGHGSDKKPLPALEHMFLVQHSDGVGKLVIADINHLDIYAKRHRFGVRPDYLK